MPSCAQHVIVGTTGAPNLRTKSLPNCILMQFAHRSKYIVTAPAGLGLQPHLEPECQKWAEFLANALVGRLLYEARVLMAEVIGLIASIINILEGVSKTKSFLKANVHAPSTLRSELVPLSGRLTAFEGILRGL
jgi:hypothetical protein